MIQKLNWFDYLLDFLRYFQCNRIILIIAIITTVTAKLLVIVIIIIIEAIINSFMVAKFTIKMVIVMAFIVTTKIELIFILS